MAKQIKLVIRYFGRGVRDLGAGWNWNVNSIAPISKGVGRNFANVGIRLSSATNRFSNAHPELTHA